MQVFHFRLQSCIDLACPLDCNLLPLFPKIFSQDSCFLHCNLLLHARRQIALRSCHCSAMLLSHLPLVPVEMDDDKFISDLVDKMPMTNSIILHKQTIFAFLLLSLHHVLMQSSYKPLIRSAWPLSAQHIPIIQQRGNLETIVPSIKSC